MKTKKWIASLCIIISAAIMLVGVGLILGNSKPSGKLAAYAAQKTYLRNSGGDIVEKSSYSETKAEAERKKKEAEEQKRKIEKELASLKTDYSNILDYIEDMDKKQNQIMLDMLSIQDDLNQLNREYQQIQLDLANAESVAEEQYKTMKKRLQYIYENGSTTYLEMILDSRSLTDLLNQVEYVGKITEYDNNLLNRYLETKRQIADYQVYLEAKIAAVEKTQEMYQNDYDFAQQIIGKKKEAMEKYQKEIGINEEILEDYIVEISKQQMTIEEAIRKEEEEIRKAKEEEERRRKEEAEKNPTNPNPGKPNYDKVPPSGYNNAADIPKVDVTDPNKMIWPLPGNSHIGSRFGPRIPPKKGASSYHKGVDIGGYTGEQIVASLAGRVTETAWNSTGGWHVYIDHGNGYVTRYLHMSKMLCSAGDYVLQGQVIGLVGSTGVSTGPHLHFSVYINGTPVDPLLYIKY